MSGQTVKHQLGKRSGIENVLTYTAGQLQKLAKKKKKKKQRDELDSTMVKFKNLKKIFKYDSAKIFIRKRSHLAQLRKSQKICSEPS